MVKHMRLWLVAEAGGRVQAAMKAAGNEGGCFVQLRYSIRLYGFGYDCTLTTCVLDLFTQQQKN